MTASRSPNAARYRDTACAVSPISGMSTMAERPDCSVCLTHSMMTRVLPAEAASQTLLKEQLADVLKTLTPREEKVLRLRFGLEDGRPRTLEEVGKEFNVTRERIRQIEAKALRKLRHPSRSKKLRDFLD